MTTAFHPSSFILPPSSRDLEIHRRNAVEFLSTYRIAEIHKISQTRIRQIIARVNDWLAEVLPPLTEADIEKQKRLAIHLAAAQLRHQIETLATYWSATGDPKYLRQQNRSILALAKLGVPATTLDALAASVEEQSEAAPDHQSEFGNPQSEIPSPRRAPHSELRASSPPPSGDCSPNSTSGAVADDKSTDAAVANHLPDFDLEAAYLNDPDTLAGLNLMEKRLLILLEDTLYSETERRQSLSETLEKVRREKVSVLKLNPKIAGVATERSPSSEDATSPKVRNDQLTTVG